MNLTNEEQACLDKFRAVIVWGCPLHTHTLSYVHAAWVKVFDKFYNKPTYWFHNGDFPQDFDFENCIFITEGYHDEKMPILASSTYFVHDAIHPEKYVDKKARLIEIRFNVEEIHDVNNYFNLNDGTHDGIINLSPETRYEKLASNKDVQHNMRGGIITPMNYECVYIYWATDLLPNEFNFEDAHYPRDNAVYYIASPRNSSNYEIFKSVCIQNGIQWFESNPQQNPLPFEVTHEYMKKSIVCPDFRPRSSQEEIDKYGIKHGGNHLETGLLPCRVLKTISYGHIGITDSPGIKKILGEHILYHPDMGELFNMAMSERTNYSRIKKAMKFVQENHTYAQRVRDLIRAILQ
jgi:hypothetical protein